MDRRAFLGIASGATAAFAGGANAAEQGDAARAGVAPLVEADRDPLGLHGNDPLTAESVRRAIERGVQYLKSTQRSDGTWLGPMHYDGGLTPLCTLALLNAGCAREDHAVAAALKFLRQFEPISTYTASLQTMVFCAADPIADRLLVEHNVKWLEGRQFRVGERRGMWATPSSGSTDHVDNSMTHFAMLALNEAERVGVAVNPEVWIAALEHWQSKQNADGSWGWGPGYEGSGSMTCAGISALVIAGGTVNQPDAQVSGEQVIGCVTQQADTYFERAMTWVTRYFSVLRNPGSEFWQSYYHYALERAGRLSGRRFFGDHDWFREGARYLVQNQQYSGAWPADVQFMKVDDKNVSTSFSLMFLAKGRWPVVIAQLRRKEVNDWNRHRAAIPNLVGHLEKSWERNLTHQVIDLQRATVDELLEAPVLFINGHEEPAFSEEEIRKLRSYVDRGGFVFAEQCCGGKEFDSGFRSAMRRAFPEEEQQLRLLPPDHAVWFAEEAVEPDVPIWGIDVGCRTAVVYCPFDVSCYWELDRIGRVKPELAAVRESIEKARRIGINVLSYATGREVAFKNPAVVVPSTNGGASQFARGTLYVANVLHGGGSHAAPAALRKLLRHAAEDVGVPVCPEPGEVRLEDENLFRYHLLYFHGRSAFELTANERRALCDYAKRGGTVLADAICSSTSFAESFRREMQLIFPSNSLEPIPANDAIWTPTYGGANVTAVSRRMKPVNSFQAAAAAEVTKAPPVVEAIRLEGRYAVIFSPLDISCALETDPLGCTGYVRKDALLIAMNVLLYSLNQ